MERIMGKILVEAAWWICVVVASFAISFTIVMVSDGQFYWQPAVYAVVASAGVWFFWSPRA